METKDYYLDSTECLKCGMAVCTCEKIPENMEDKEDPFEENKRFWKEYFERFNGF